LRVWPSIFLKGLSQRKTSLLTCFVGPLALVGQSSIHRKAPTQVTCAHCQRSITCDSFFRTAPRRFVPGEPPILHPVTGSSTPFCEELLLGGCRPGRIWATGRE
jgi:hypothetical protein